jgi:UDP-N-acetyl-D-mannosaminuronate dehydrogenase
LCAKQGHETVGFEKNSEVVSKLSLDQCHIKDALVENLLAEALGSGNAEPTEDVDQNRDCSIYFICVPRPIDINNDPGL